MISSSALIYVNRRAALPTVLLLLAGSQLSCGVDVMCGPEGLRVLGSNSWDIVSGKVDATFNNECMYAMEIQFQHASTLPLPNDPATQCDPTVVPPVLAADGLPFYAARWFYEKVPEHVQAATGIDHISIDFNPCGHPPVDIFTAPHYDLHTYRVTPEYRTCMTCELFPGTPICNFPLSANDTIPQSTPFGRAFFAPVDSNNFPVGFEVLKTDNVPLMGGHAGNPAQLPADVASWTEPVLIVGPYNGTNIYYEPMIPLGFMMGSHDNHFVENVTYVNRTIENLPTEWQVHYEASSGVVTVNMMGQSSVCQDECASSANRTECDAKDHCDWTLNACRDSTTKSAAIMSTSTRHMVGVFLASMMLMLAVFE